MERRSRVGITVSSFRQLKTDTCLTRKRKNVYTAPLLITSWEEILLVSESYNYLFSPCNIKKSVAQFQIRILSWVSNSRARGP